MLPMIGTLLYCEVVLATVFDLNISQFLYYKKFSWLLECKDYLSSQIIVYISCFKNLTHETRVQVMFGFVYFYHQVL